MSFSLSVLCSCQDPSIAKNPGPYTPKPFPHESPEEKLLFLRLRKLNDDLIKLKSHTTFLQNCLNNNIIPNGLSSSLPNAVAKPDDNLQYKLELLDNSNSFNAMKVIISHYEIEILKLTEEIHSTKQQLSDLTTSSRFTFLLKSLESFIKKKSKGINFIKSKQFKRLQKQKLQSTQSLTRGHKNLTSWIPELFLTGTEKQAILNDDYICNQIIYAAMTLLHQQKPFLMFQSTAFNYQFLQYYPFETICVHHDGKNHFVTSTSVGGNVKLFDSFNLLPSEDLMKQITVLYSPDIKTIPTVLKAEMRSIQQGSKDCGLFAIVYATEIAYGHDPSSFVFDQSILRHHLHDCLVSKSLTRFPKKDQLKTKTTFTNITSNYQQHQTWETPSKRVRPLINKSPPVFETHNCSKALSLGTARNNKQPAGTMFSNTMPTSNKTTRPPAPKTLSNTTESLIVNLSKRSLTETEKSVLQLGLTFCPSPKNLNKEQLALDLFNFIHRLKLREHFFHNPSQPQSANDGDKTVNQEDDLPWKDTNSHWYPQRS